jgi:hypothetical protein
VLGGWVAGVLLIVASAGVGAGRSDPGLNRQGQLLLLAGPAVPQQPGFPRIDYSAGHPGLKGVTIVAGSDGSHEAWRRRGGW